MVKLKRLKILKYRNVRPGTELRFDDGVNLVLGQNASGKTTLLALISAVCRGDFTCRLEQVDGREQMVWENMSEENAERFYAAYQTGIEYIGDILITRGLW